MGLTFEPGLVERLLDDVGQEPGNLPLLEFALTNLWERRQGGQLLHQAYDDMGRVQGAVAQKAEEIYRSLAPLEQQAAARVFLELVQTGENTEDTRRRAPLTEVGEEARDLVKKLADARLVVTGREEATGQETVEVAHEALIRHWSGSRAGSTPTGSFCSGASACATTWKSGSAPAGTRGPCCGAPPWPKPKAG